MNTCYISFGMYEHVREGTGREWRECVCGRWVHEDCIDVVVESCGKERLCPVCVI